MHDKRKSNILPRSSFPQKSPPEKSTTLMESALEAVVSRERRGCPIEPRCEGNLGGSDMPFIIQRALVHDRGCIYG